MKFLPKRAALISVIVVLSFIINALANKCTAALFNAEWVEVAVTSQVSVISYSYFAIIPIKIVTALALKVTDTGEPLSGSQSEKKSKRQNTCADEQILVSKHDLKVKKESLSQLKAKFSLFRQEFLDISRTLFPVKVYGGIILLFILFILIRKDLYPDISKKINKIIETRPDNIWPCFFIGGTK